MSCNFLLSSLILHSKEKVRMAWLNHTGMDSFSFQHAGLFKISMQFLLFLFHFMTITPACEMILVISILEFWKEEREYLSFPRKHNKVIVLAWIRCSGVSRSYSIYLILCSLAEGVCFHADAESSPSSVEDMAKIWSFVQCFCFLVWTSEVCA